MIGRRPLDFLRDLAEGEAFDHRYDQADAEHALSAFRALLAIARAVENEQYPSDETRSALVALGGRHPGWRAWR